MTGNTHLERASRVKIKIEILNYKIVNTKHKTENKTQHLCQWLLFIVATLNTTSNSLIILSAGFTWHRFDLLGTLIFALSLTSIIVTHNNNKKQQKNLTTYESELNNLKEELKSINKEEIGQ